jgi:hypothetical protein
MLLLLLLLLVLLLMYCTEVVLLQDTASKALYSGSSWCIAMLQCSKVNVLVCSHNSTQLRTCCNTLIDPDISTQLSACMQQYC